MIFYETSAKTGDGVKELFQAIAAKEYANIQENKWAIDNSGFTKIFLVMKKNVISKK